MAVGEWIQSYEPFHVMRDHPAHCGWPVNAGMWGGVKGALQVGRSSNRRQAIIQAYLH